MATFTVDTKALNSIQNKFKQTAELYKAYAVQEVNKAVKAMEQFQGSVTLKLLEVKVKVIRNMVWQ